MSISVDFPEFKKLAKEFFDALPEAEEDEAQGGFKCLTLAYINMSGTENEKYQASIVVKQAALKMLESEFLPVH